MTAVSIIIPCYRQAHLLPSAINSALAQTYPNVEVIVVNDGSDDSTGAVALEYGTRIIYVVRTNGGLPAARNTGIQHATGKYLLFLDSDDVLHHDAVRWLVEAMDSSENRLCVLGFQTFENDVADIVDNQHFPPPDLSHPLPFLIHENLAPPLAFLTPRKAVVEVGCFDESLQSCEDWDLWCRLALNGADLITIRRIGAYYRRYSGSMSTNLRRMLKTRTQVLIHLHRRIVRNPTFIGLYGEDLLEAEHRVSRRLKVQNGCTDMLATIEAAMGNSAHLV